MLKIIKNQFDALAFDSSGPPVVPCNKPVLDLKLIDLARKPGNDPDQIAARAATIEHFYLNTPGFLPPPCSQHERKRAFQQQLKGFDLDQPIEITTVPPPDELRQFVRRSNGKLGQFFDPNGGQSADSLGLNGDPVIREPARVPLPKEAKFPALRSTAKPIIDDWTDLGSPRPCRGGGSQLVLPDAALKDLKPIPCR